MGTKDFLKFLLGEHSKGESNGMKKWKKLTDRCSAMEFQREENEK